GLLDAFGDAHGFLAAGDPFLELAELGEAPDEDGARGDRQGLWPPQAVPQVLPPELLTVLAKQRDGALVVGEPVAHLPEPGIGADRQHEIVEPLGEGMRALARLPRPGA